MNHKIKTLQDKKRQAYTEWKGIMDAAKSRAMTAEETRLADEYEATIDDCNDKIECEKTGGGYGSREAKLAAIGAQLERDSRPEPGQLQQIGGPRHHDRPDSSFAYRNERSGEWIRSAGGGEALDVDAPAASPGELGEAIRGMALGRFSSPSTQAAVRENSDNQGGFLVPTHIANSVIDNARNRMVMTRAGMRTIPFPDTGNELALGKVTADPVCYWRHEGTAITASGPTFSKIFLRPKVLGCLVPTSIEFLEDVANAEQMLENIIERALAIELDRAILRGDGGGAELCGVRYTDDVQTSAVDGAWNYDTLVDGMKLLWDENAGMPSAFILSPAAEAYRRKSKDGDGQYLWTQETPIDGVPFLFTNQCPDTEIYCGDFSRVLLAVKTNLKIEVLPAGTGSDASGNSYNATSQMWRWVRVYMRCDCHVEWPEHILVHTGCTQ